MHDDGNGTGPTPERDAGGRFMPGHSGNPNGRPPAECSRVERMRARLKDRACTSPVFTKIAEGLELDPQVVTIDDVLLERDLVGAATGSDAYSRLVWDRVVGSVKQQVAVEETRYPVRILGPWDPIPVESDTAEHDDNGGGNDE